MSSKRPDILILGGGILGSATAWHLSRAGVSDITVVDLDLAGNFSSSELNAGGARATWWNSLNVDLAWDSLRFYQTLEEEIQFFQRGYLFLYHRHAWQTALEKQPQYESRKIPVEYLAPEDIRRRLPEFENLKGVAGATFSPRDGLLDPHLLKEFYRQQARKAGVKFLDRYFITGFSHSGRRITEVQTRHWESPPLSETLLHEILTRHRLPEPDRWQPVRFQPDIVVNCTGAWLPMTSSHYHHPHPLRPVRRQISLFSSHEEDLSDRGMIVDSSGLYFHPEGSHSGLILAGYSNRNEKPGYSFAYDGEPFFDRKIWLRLYRRGGRKHFTALKHVRGWAGLYAVPPDKTAILGRVAGFHNLYELGGATGRGVMQSFALGRGLAELILSGRFESLDLTPLNASRFGEDRLQREHLDI